MAAIQCLLWAIYEIGITITNRGAYMSAHTLLNLLNELRKRDKMQGLPSILSFFRNEFYKCNNTGARILDSIKIILKSYFWHENARVLPYA